MQGKTSPGHFSSWEQAVRWLRAQPDKTELVLAAYYDDPLGAAAERYHSSEEWSALRGHLPASRGTALDVGAGRGIASYALAKDGFNVIALEPDPSALVGAAAIKGLANELNLPIRVVEEVSEKLPFEDGAFDVVFARAVLHHTQDLEVACREFFRVIKPGGLFIAIREHVISREEDLESFFKAHPLHSLYGGENAYLLSKYKDAIRSAGFALNQVYSPLESPINYAPQTLNVLRDEIAARATSKLPFARCLVRFVLGLPWVWPIVLPLLTYVDDRPGRLYSFLATRPG
jgi:SAM-dependent methyltransferase